VTESLLLAFALFGLLALDLATVAARTAFQGSSYARLLGLREQYGKRSNRAISLYQAYPRLLASLRLALVMARFLLAGGVLFILFRQSPAISWWWALLVLLGSALLLFFFEYGLAIRVLREPERSAVRLGLFTYLVTIVLSPLTAIPLALSKDAVKLVESTGAVTEDELKNMVDAGQEEGVIEQGERRMIYSVIDLGDTLAREIMVPRIDMLALEVNIPLKEAIDAFLNSGHSRVPVYENTIDHILGLLYAKDLLRVWAEGKQLDSLRSLLRQVYYIPEAKKVYELLAELQSQRIHMAVVVDEYGGIAGMVTLEDIVEEILGEIRDEYDQAEELPYQVLKNGDYIYQGGVDLDDFNETLGSSLPKGEADTLGGYIYAQLGHVPVLGETIQAGNLRLIVEQVSARRIRKVRARWILPEERSKEENDHAIG
jgi:CBS domain containing-hemolysin-like protein